MRASIYIAFLSFILPGIAFSQTSSTFSISEYNTENGLPANGVKGIAYDKETNFLWIGTEAGVVRFNGQDFKTFTTRELPELASERISKLTKNVAGNIVIFDTENNIFTIDKNKPVLLRKKDTLRYINYNRAISSELSNPQLLEKIEYGNSSDKYNTLLGIIGLGDTACIVTTNQKKILLFNVNKQKPDTIGYKGNYIKSLFKIADQPFFADIDGNIFSINFINQRSEPIILKTSNGIIDKEEVKKSIITWNNGEQNSLLFRNNEASILTLNGQNIEAKLICNTIPTTSNIRFATYQPESKQILIGTESKGIILIKPNYFETIRATENNPLIPNATYTQIPVGEKQLLINDAVVLGKGNKSKSDLPINEKFGLSTYLLNDSILLYSKKHATTLNHALHSFNYYTGITTDYPNIRINGTFGASYSNNKIFLYTAIGFGVLNNDSIDFMIKQSSEQLVGMPATDMTEIRPGVFLTASCKGLIQFDTHTKKADTLLHYPGNCFRTIQKLGEYYFIGTYGAGFFMYKNGVLKKMPIDKEQYLLYAHCFIADRNGFCWISTNRGLFKASIYDLTRAFEENLPTVYYHYFGKNDGIEMSELNGGCTPCALALKDGTFSFPSMDGLLWVHPDSIPDIIPGSNVFIDEIITDDTTFNNNFENIELPAFTNSISIKLSYIGWGNKENIYIEYRLGDNSPWKPVKTETEAVIQLDNLPAGKYILTIRKLNGYGKANYSYKKLTFSIEKPWFNSWWFYLLCLAGLLFVIRLYLKHKTRVLELRKLALEQQVAEKTKALVEKNDALEKNISVQTRLISIISHDIITPLKFMAVGGKKLIEKGASMPESLQKETIEEITNTSQELQLLSTNIMNWMKYQNENRIQVKENFNLFESTQQVTGILKTIAKQKDITIQNNIPKDLIIFQYYEPLKILVYNLVSNSINFSNHAVIIIDAKSVEKDIILSVTDHGVGMTPEQIKNILSDDFIISSANIDNRKGNGLGYLIIKDLLKMIDGNLTIESKKGKGTKVSIRFCAA